MGNAIIKINELELANLNLVDQIIAAGRDENVENIILVITSGGGCIDTIIPICEATKISGKPIITIGMVEVASSAASIFMMGSRRILVPGTTFLLHKAGIQLEQGRYSVDELSYMLDETIEATKIAWSPIIENSKITLKILNKKCKDKNWELTEKEVEDYGIITEKYDRTKLASLFLLGE